MGDRSAAREPMAEPATLPWGVDKAGAQKSALTDLTDEKLARFVLGQQKKTKFEKEREERGIKKRKADEEAAAMYAKFVASFEDEDETLGKAFVRGRGSHDDAIYRLKGTGGKKKLADMDHLVHEMKQKETTGHADSFLQAPIKKKRREMDLLVEEIKSREPSLPTADEIGPIKGSFDTGDPETTNLHVGNLPVTVTEELLERVFGKFGRIYSVKIMWPRTDEEKARRRMNGFVSFYERRAADDARVHLHDSELDGQRIVVGWGKAIKIEARLPSPLPASVMSAMLPAAMAHDAADALEGKPRILVELPRDESLRQLIDRVASYVAKDGSAFENALRLRESRNPQYAFLCGVPDSPAAVYYRWRVFAFAMGDREHQWRETPFQMTMNGSVWVPPPVPSRHHHHQHHDNESDRGRDSGRTRTRSSRSRSRSRSRSYERRRRSRSRSRSRTRSRHRSRSRSCSGSGSRDRRRSRRRSRSRSYSSSSGSESTGSASPVYRYDRRGGRASRSPSRSRDRTSSYHRGRDDRNDRDRSRSRSRRPHEENAMPKKDESMLTGQQLARARDLERGREPNRLSRDERDKFEELLDNLTLERESIKQAMGCALDNSESAVELVHLLRRRFARETDGACATPVQLIGYLYVASDLLHNSSVSVKNASLFRTTFQECLPEILDRLRRVHRAIQGRMSAIAMRDKVLSVLTAWGSWSLFPPHYLVGLNATFLRKVEEAEYMASDPAQSNADGALSVSEDETEKLRKACSQAGIMSSGSARELLARLRWLKEFTAPATVASVSKKAVVKAVLAKEVKDVQEEMEAEAEMEPMEEDAVQDDIDGEPMDATEKKSTAQEDCRDSMDGEPLDGEPLDGESLDGEPLDGEPLDGEPFEEGLDGEPLDGEEEDVDGVPLDDEDDLDGEPM